MRSFWKADLGRLRLEWASRFAGSARICFATTGVHRLLQLNFLTSHDGFTLNDLVSYNHKHNEANLEKQSRR